MNDIKILEAVESYIRGEMNPDERLHFENLRKTNPEIDQLVVEHTLFLQQMNRFGEWKKFRTVLQDTHIRLAEQGKIESSKLKGKAKLVYLWKRYQRVAAFAAIIAGITTLSIIAIAIFFGPANPDKEIQNLNRKLRTLENRTNEQDKEINNVKNRIEIPVINYKTGGTSFLIDGKGFLVTNAHVVQNARNIAVENIKGENFNAVVIYTDISRDIAILKIEDSSFKAVAAIPYSFSKSPIELAEPVYTLGYPRDEVVYSQGYLSAKTGYHGDTMSCQVTIAVNPGNSGGPVLDRNGDIIGMLSTRQRTAEGVVFATRAKYILHAIDDMKHNSKNEFQKVKAPSGTALKGLERQQQVKKIQDYIFMVKVN
jgi:serine protease Do